jgi:hypothetical protein
MDEVILGAVQAAKYEMEHFLFRIFISFLILFKGALLDLF